MKRQKSSVLGAPFLKRVWLDDAIEIDKEQYPFCLPLFSKGEFEISFSKPITIITGENGSGKSTILEGIAGLAGYDDAGGGKGYRPVDHGEAIEAMGGSLAKALRASWLPKVTDGWFFRAESFFSVARYLDKAARDARQAPPDFLSHSHGEGFLRFFEERCRRRGLFMLDEPESALSPTRQIELIKILRRVTETKIAQVIMITHSPLLMAFPDAQLLSLTRRGIEEIEFEDTEHFRFMSRFYRDPRGFIEEKLADDDGSL